MNKRVRQLMNISVSIFRLHRLTRPPIIIGGCARTGTTLMSSILSAHKNIFVLGYETSILIGNRKTGFDKINSFVNRCKLVFIMLLQGIPPEARCWCEKTPKNVRYLDLILKEFKNIKIILMVRDCRDVITSVHPKKSGYYVGIDQWISDTKETLKFSNNRNVIIVPYERLVKDFNYSIDKIFNFLELPISNEIKDFHKNTRVKNHDAFHQGEVKPIYLSAVTKWKNQEHRERLLEFTSNKDACILNSKILELSDEF